MFQPSGNIEFKVVASYLIYEIRKLLRQPIIFIKDFLNSHFRN
ncbi:hypothetical protein LEP1GSC036_4409 [Leptospira weilii str. 2006001853]|uniref:Uncharacterized protein n=3 Tax=Leptospira weilii TaxID=28184 RepID=A0A828Z426_9LEPT|nr:hypothetical protein LEP1GSC036_4409 [Leptospira weilii str. 2006001853]EMJ59908.1 hypothetical protein LEP1GSC051_0789 [Leptospira sp. P2653]EMM71743.1 hypothetical protein LEP1GSC038_3957 [Leptospira weilii str. 2006001855]EMN46396.1 hypothetical protein LEP1GSC086_3104 [Leptospira weilii str. LNT 1234]EMN87852.1 hypothetical protein LEP1GSC108_1098 [Leptospira weilii str. UI 13098]